MISVSLLLQSNGCTGGSNGADVDDAMDSFIDEDMEDNLAREPTAPGSATKKRKGQPGSSFARMPQAQNAFQPGATTLGENPKSAQDTMFFAMF